MFKRMLLFSFLCALGFGSFYWYSPLPVPMPAPKKKSIRVYADMVGDMFHAGHVQFLKKAREFGDELIVGVLSDEDATPYKRKPIMTLEERVEEISACRYVDEVIPKSPMVTTKEFMEKHNIDIVVHGDDYSQEQQKAYYDDAIKMGKFRMVSYTKGISTSDLIARIKERFI